MKLVENGSDDVSMNGDESAIRPRPCRTYAELDEQEWPQPRARRHEERSAEGITYQTPRIVRAQIADAVYFAYLCH